MKPRRKTRLERAMAVIEMEIRRDAHDFAEAELARIYAEAEARFLAAGGDPVDWGHLRLEILAPQKSDALGKWRGVPRDHEATLRELTSQAIACIDIGESAFEYFWWVHRPYTYGSGRSPYGSGPPERRPRGLSPRVREIIPNLHGWRVAGAEPCVPVGSDGPRQSP